MNAIHLLVQHAGPLVEVSIGISAASLIAFRKAGRPVPAPMIVNALIDTGAEVSAADPSVFNPLAIAGIVPIRFVFANLPAAGQQARPVAEYAVSLAVGASTTSRQAAQLRNFSVIEQPLLALGYQAILGRDVLAHCLLVYDGPNQRVTLGI